MSGPVRALQLPCSKSDESDRERGEDQQRLPGKVDRRAAYGLVDASGQVPRSRQQLAPGIGESIHAEARKTDSHEAERRRRYQGGNAYRGDRRLEQQRQQRSQKLT